MTYRDVWTKAREGAYPQSPRGAYRCWRDLIQASRPVLRPLVTVTVLGYGQPSALAWEDEL